MHGAGSDEVVLKEDRARDDIEIENNSIGHAHEDRDVKGA